MGVGLSYKGVYGGGGTERDDWFGSAGLSRNGAGLGLPDHQGSEETWAASIAVLYTMKTLSHAWLYSLWNLGLLSPETLITFLNLCSVNFPLY